MTEPVFYHNPRCSKSRQALALLLQHGIHPRIIEYLKTGLNEAEIRALKKALGIDSVRDVMRTKEADYKDNGLSDVTDEAALIRALTKWPKVLERPILMKGDKAVIGRPPEQILTVL